MDGIGGLGCTMVTETSVETEAPWLSNTTFLHMNTSEIISIIL